MANFKYKLKENIVKPKDLDPEFIKRIEKRFGEMDMTNDFFSDDLSTYFKTSSIDKETGNIGHSIIKLGNFGDALKELNQALEAMVNLSKTSDGKADPKIALIAQDLRGVFNKFRTHIRNEYPEQYIQIKNLLGEMSSISSNSGFVSGGEGENHTGPSPRKSTYGAYTQAGYKKVTEGPISKEEAWKEFFKYHELGKQKSGIADYAYKEFEKGWNEGKFRDGNYERISESNPGATMGPGPKAGPEGVTKNKYVTDFKYKLVNQKALNKKAKGIIVKPLWEATDTEDFLNGINITDPDKRKFITDRLEGFDTLEEKLNALIPLLQSAKHETMDYYRANPNSFAVVYGTDLANDYLNDLIDLFKKQ